MSFSVTVATLLDTQSEAFKYHRDNAVRLGMERDVTIDVDALTSDDIQELITSATAQKDTKAVRAAEAMLHVRSGDFSKPVPNFKAFLNILENFLKHNIIDGWIYVEHDDGFVYPELVTKVVFDAGVGKISNGQPSVTIHGCRYGLLDASKKQKIGNTRTQHTFYPQDVARRKIESILSAAGIYKENASLKKAYLEQNVRYRESKVGLFAHQFRLNGAVYRFEENNWGRRGVQLTARKVIHDLEPSNFGPMDNSVESSLFDDHPTANGIGEVPEHPLIRVYDLDAHEYLWANADALTLHTYDKSLREKLVLPDTHRDLLDVLTTDLGAFVSDFVEGKSAGNVILCKGVPGVGKTLTAELYAELIEKPLLSIHSGTLGICAEEIDKNLKASFQMAKRWGVPMLLDEADVFVASRGLDLNHNAVVATFLRSLEYYDGLLFMTTNRSNDIDDAIISRCAAIINYELPEKDRTVAIWKVMAEQFQSPLSDELISNLLDAFPTIAPRDIKMLFRLALRVTTTRGEPLDIDLFRRCAMFRAIHMPEKV